MSPLELENLVADLVAMPRTLASAAQRMHESAWHVRLADQGFCLVEQAWHLADLEREGYGVRIQLLLTEDDLFLPNFDGDRIARERDYRAKSLAEGIAAFSAARAANVGLLRSVPPGLWIRTGRQEEVGTVTLADIPHMMLEHDTSHRAEIAALIAGVPGRTESPGLGPRDGSGRGQESGRARA
jgi:hypothetical protein